MKSKSMRPRASLYKAHILIAVVPMLLAASSQLLAQVRSAPQESPSRILEELAREKFGKLTPTESRVVWATASGKVAWGGDVKDQPTNAAAGAAYNKPSNDPANATEYNWRDYRSVRAELIRWLCEDEKARKLVDQHGIDIVGAWIDGVVDLSYLHTNVRITLSKCRIPNGIKLTSAEISDLALVGSWIGDHTGMPGQEQIALNGEGLTVHGNLILSNGFRAFGQVDLYGAKINGQLYCTEGQFWDPGGHSLRLRLASIDGETELNKGFRSDGVVDLVGARIKGDLLMDGADFSGDLDSGLKAKGLTARALYWTHVRTSDQTELDLSNANIGIFKTISRVGLLRGAWPLKASSTGLLAGRRLTRRVDSIGLTYNRFRTDLSLISNWPKCSSTTARIQMQPLCWSLRKRKCFSRLRCRKRFGQNTCLVSRTCY
jgi:hypothetical protein